MSNWNESAGPRYLFVATNLVQNKWELGNLHDHKQRDPRQVWTNNIGNKEKRLILTFDWLKNIVASPVFQFRLRLKNILSTYLFWIAVSVIWVQFLSLAAGVKKKTLLDFVYCRESFSDKQFCDRGLYKVSNLVSTLF